MYLKNLKYLLLMAVLGLLSVVVQAAQEPPMGYSVISYKVAPGMEANFEQISAQFKKALIIKTSSDC